MFKIADNKEYMTLAMAVAVLAVCALMLVSVNADDSDAARGGSESNPIQWYNPTIILLPEVTEVSASDLGEGDVSVAPTSLVIDWGDGRSETKEVSGWIAKGSLEVLHTYSAKGVYHITATPAREGYIYTNVYELYVQYMGYPVVTVHDGSRAAQVEVSNGYGVGAAKDNYFAPLNAETATKALEAQFSSQVPSGQAYKVDGWYSDSAMTRAYAFDPVKGNEDVYVKSSYGYLVTFVDEDGNVLDEQRVSAGAKADQPKGDYKYYTDKDHKTEYTFGAVNGATTVYVVKNAAPSSDDIVAYAVIAAGVILLLVAAFMRNVPIAIIGIGAVVIGAAMRWLI